LEPASALGWVQIEVSDTGHGIPRELLRRVFEPFFTTKKEGRGTGLGLATVRRVVKDARGRVEVFSTVGQGTTFRIYLPITEQPVPALLSTEKSAYRGRGENVLVLDDEDAVRRTTCRLLRRAGYNASEARTAAEAVGLVESGTFVPRLLLADVILASESGIEVARMFTKRWPEIAVVLMTGYDRESLHMGDTAFDVLFKPFPPDRLLRRLAHAIARGADRPTEEAP
jgi:CheY-like chemotaxis protein